MEGFCYERSTKAITKSSHGILTKSASYLGIGELCDGCQLHMTMSLFYSEWVFFGTAHGWGAKNLPFPLFLKSVAHIPQ